MSDSFAELVERYRRELAQYSRKGSVPAAPPVLEPEIPSEIPTEPDVSPVFEPETTPEAPPESAAPPVFEPETTLDSPTEPTAPPVAEPDALQETELNDLSGAMLCHPDDTDTATLVVQVFTARQAVPVPEADVSVYCGDGSGNVLIAFRTTDADGKTEPLLLSAPNRAFSETPEPPERPYAVYRVRIDHPEYVSETLEEVQLFGGVESILPVELTPYIPVDEPKPLRIISLPGHSLNTETEADQE